MARLILTDSPLELLRRGVITFDKPKSIKQYINIPEKVVKNAPSKKRCRKCHKLKPIDKFYMYYDKRDRAWRYGSICKKCKKVYQEEYRNRPENSEKMRAYPREYNRKMRAKNEK